MYMYSEVNCLYNLFILAQYHALESYMYLFIQLLSFKYYLQLRLGKEILNLFKLLIFEYVIQQLALCKVNVLRCTGIFFNKVFLLLTFFRILLGHHWKHSVRPKLENQRTKISDLIRFPEKESQVTGFTSPQSTKLMS